MTSRLCQMWLPDVMTSTPASRSSSAPRGLIPFPFDAFSPLATTKSSSASRRSRARTVATARRPGRPTTSPRNRSRISMSDLAGPGLPDHGHLDLTRVGHLLLDPPRHVARQQDGLVVGYGAGIDDDADLPSGLHGIGPLDAFEGVADALQIVEPFGVALEDFAARPWARARERIGGVHQRRENRLRLHLLMVGRDGIHDLGILAILARDLASDDGVRALDLVGESLPDVV